VRETIIVEKFPVERESVMTEKEKTMAENGKPVTFVDEVSEILYYYDPAGLAKFYAPEDEYSSQAASIVRQLADVDDMVSLRWMVYDVFYRMFDGAYIKPSSDRRYRYIAEEIWELWQEKLAKA